METLHKLEVIVASWYKNAPHLPEGSRRWIARNVWWLTLVSVILSSIGAGVILLTFIAGIALLGLVGEPDYGLEGSVLAAGIITAVFTLANVIIAAIAISPLKLLRRAGWRLLFVVALINLVSVVVVFIVGYDLFGLMLELLFAIVGGYLLFEIRSYFREPEKKSQRHDVPLEPTRQK